VFESRIAAFTGCPDIDIDLHPAAIANGTTPVWAHGIGGNNHMPPGHRTGKISWILPFLARCCLHQRWNSCNTLLDQGTHKTHVRCVSY
jgi:hypothetical protein